MFDDTRYDAATGHYKGDLDLDGYAPPLPATLARVGGALDLGGYAPPLPATLASVGGYLYLRRYAHPLPAALIAGMNVPIVPHIDAAILAAVEAGALMRVANWHTCDTTHCRGGWAINLAGEAGYALERRVGSEGAAALIYEASRPGVMRPNFYASDADAMADLRRCAERAGE